jgi:hypothetical protein
MLMLPELLLAPTVTRPGIVSCEAAAKVMVPEPVPEVVPPSWRLWHVALATSIVTVNPPLMITTSALVGAGLPPHVAGALQLPD